METREVRPPNSVILLGDSASTDVPEHMRDVVEATPSIVAVATRSEADGTTVLRLTDSLPSHLPTPLAFNGVISVESKRFVVESTIGERYFERLVDAAELHVSIWVNDPSEPTEVLIAIGL